MFEKLMRSFLLFLSWSLDYSRKGEEKEEGTHCNDIKLQKIRVTHADTVLGLYFQLIEG